MTGAWGLCRVRERGAWGMYRVREHGARGARGDMQGQGVRGAGAARMRGARG